MDQVVYTHIRRDGEMLHFLRQHPIWYRTLARDPSSFEQFQQEVRIYYGKTVPQRIEKIKNQIEMVDLVIALSKAMKD